MNLTALAIAATAINIIDFQGRALDLTNGLSNDFVPVQAFQSLNVVEQKWLLQSTSPIGISPFTITNSHTGSFLSYPSAGFPALTSIGNVIRQQAMAHTSVSPVTTWDVESVAGGVRITEAATGLALTSWAADPQAASASNPLTLEAAVAGDRQQIFTLQNAPS